MFFVVAMLPSTAAPPFDGKGESFPGYAMDVELRCQVMNLEIGHRAFVSVSQMESAARDVCMATGSAKVMEPDAVGRALLVLRYYFAPDALVAVYPDMVRFFAFQKNYPPHKRKFGQAQPFAT